MKNKKININRPAISDKEIDQYKNFNLLMDRYSHGKTGFPKFKGKSIVMASSAGVVIIVVVLTVYYSFLQPKDSTTSNSKTIIKETFIKPPVPSWDVPYKSFQIENNQDKVIKTNSGTVIGIPAMCLEDEQGNKVTDSIEIRYREFPSPAEIFLSGIPMVYDSAGVKHNFESAGMIEINAYRHNKPLRISQGKKIDIYLVSASAENSYNLYYFDNNTGKWVYNGKDKVEQKKDKKAVARKSKELPTVPEPIVSEPIPPVMAKKDKFHLTLDLVKGEFPELDLYGKTAFEIDESYRPLNKKHSQIVWDDVAMLPGPKPMTYYLNFKSGKDSCQYLVAPVLDANDYSKAKVQYDSLYKQYSKALEQRRASDRLRVDTCFTMTYEAVATQGKILRSFSIQKFGIWNSDRFRVIPNERTILPEFYVNDTVYEQTAYLVDRTNNAVITYYVGQQFRYNQHAQNLIWFVTHNNKIAVFTSSDIKNITPGVVKPKLKMRVLKKAIRSSEDFIELFKKGFEE